MVGAPDVVQPWMPRAARDRDAWFCHVSIAGGARRRGCAAAGVSEFFSGPLDLTVWAPERRAAADRRALDGRAAARAVIARLAVGNEAAGVCAALRDRAAQGGAHGAAQVVELGLV